MMGIQRFVEILQAKAKPPVAILLGAPGEVCTLLGHVRHEGTICYQMDLYPADRLRESLAEQNLTAQVVASADAWDVPELFASVIYVAPESGERSLKLDGAEQVRLQNGPFGGGDQGMRRLQTHSSNLRRLGFQPDPVRPVRLET